MSTTTNIPRSPGPARKKAVSKKSRAVAAKKAVSLDPFGRMKKVAAKRARPTEPEFLSVEALLGGAKVIHSTPHTSLDWVSVVRKGISSHAVDCLIRRINVSQSEFSTFLDIPERTLVRRKSGGSLSSEETEKLVRMAHVVERASEVFEGMEEALDWLKSPNAAMSGVIPMSLLDTEIGAKVVMDTLGRIEHGVFA